MGKGIWTKHKLVSFRSCTLLWPNFCQQTMAENCTRFSMTKHLFDIFPVWSRTFGCFWQPSRPGTSSSRILSVSMDLDVFECPRSLIYLPSPNNALSSLHFNQMVLKLAPLSPCQISFAKLHQEVQLYVAVLFSSKSVQPA